jgi:4-hydroxy-tetrahydrodipicolinate synthase
MDSLTGVYLPLVTPFHEGALDRQSLRGMVQHYSTTGIAGLVLLGTTGESPTIEPAEQDAIIETAMEAAAGTLPIYLGVSGNSTRHVAEAITERESIAVDGYMVVAPYYNRPPADGLVAHFRTVAAATERPIIIYNVPYRTGVNLSNESLFEIVASASNVRAIKDTTGNITQSLDLLHSAPPGLSVLTGEDVLYFTGLANGAAGGILASAHLATTTFVEVYTAMAKEELGRARTAWRGISPMVPRLFQEANPMPIKYCLWRQGLLRSPECRLPLTGVSAGLAATLDEILAKLPA